MTEQAAETDRSLLVLRDTDAADDPARADDADGLLVGGHVPDRLQDSARAVPTGELTDPGDSLLTPLGDHVGDAERPRSVRARWRPISARGR